MDCVPVPDEVKQLYPNSETKTFAPPSGDMLDDTIRGAEVILDVADSVNDYGTPSLHLYFKLDADDLKKLLEEGHDTVELTILGLAMPPVAMRVV